MSAPTFSHRSYPPVRSSAPARTALSAPIPAISAGRLSRYRVRADRPGLELEAGETVLYTPYEPTALGMVVLVPCEVDDHSPGARVPGWALEFPEHTAEHANPAEWSEFGRYD